jgi:murein DD-endopeptidase MepM/ murein hydrolase activator NlpD
VTFAGTLSYSLARHTLPAPVAAVAEAAAKPVAKAAATPISAAKPAEKPADKPVAAAQRAPELTHQVQPGETLAAIARLYQVDVAVVKQANGLKNDQIRAGQVLAIPGGQPAQRIAVAEGDSLWGLASRFGTTVSDILAVNPDIDPGHLKIGAILTLPKGAKERDGVVAAMADPGPLSGLFKWPLTAPISSLFGPRDGTFHFGLDLAANMSEPIHAAREGDVIYAGWMTGYGNLVQLRHPDGTETWYGHASKLLVTVGQHVKQGDAISLVGSTGHSTGPHLHFEIHVNNQARDPLLYLPKL